MLEALRRKHCFPQLRRKQTYNGWKITAGKETKPASEENRETEAFANFFPIKYTHFSTELGMGSPALSLLSLQVPPMPEEPSGDNVGALLGQERLSWVQQEQSRVCLTKNQTCWASSWVRAAFHLSGNHSPEDKGNTTLGLSAFLTSVKILLLLQRHSK